MNAWIRFTGFSIFACLLVPAIGRAQGPGMGVECQAYGKTAEGESVEVYTLANGRGLEARVMTYGATLISFAAPDRAGKSENITLNLDSLEDYLKGHPCYGSVVGRFANRIAGAKFTIDGKEYAIEANAGKNHIHGGKKASFMNVVWKAQPIKEADAVGVKLTHTSKDGDAGYPGTVEVVIQYKLTAENHLVMEYRAKTDKPTHVNLTNHAYWNLAGAGSGDVLKHVLYLNADNYLPSDKEKIPTGQIKPVKGTVMDFTTAQAIGSRIEQVEGQNYDHCYVINKKPGEKMPLCARVSEPKSGRVMEVYTTQPGVQLFTAKFKFSRGSREYLPYSGLCLETQHYPDSPNKPGFPPTVLRPGEEYVEVTEHRFGVEK